MRMSQADLIKIALVFVNLFAGAVVAYPGPELGALSRLFCVALVAGCGGALAFLDKLGAKPRTRTLDVDEMTPAQRRRLAMKLKAEMLEQP